MGDLIEDYLLSLKTDGRKPGTIQNAKEGLIRFKKSIGEKDMLDIDRGDIDKYITEMAVTNSPWSQSLQIGIVKRFYDYIVEDLELLEKNPVARKAKRMRNCHNMTERPKRSFEEVREFVRGIKNLRDQAITVLLFKTLIRNGELVALTLDDLDEKRGYLTVDKHVDGVGGGTIHGRKNGNVTTIPLDNETIRVIRRYLKVRPSVDDNSLFLSKMGIGISMDVSRMLLDGWSKKLNFGANGGKYSKAITPHWIRAYSTMELERRGMNQSVIQYIRGDLPLSTMAVYSRAVLHPEEVKKEYEEKIFKFVI